MPHKRLLCKLLSYKLDKTLIAWIEAFLCHRMQQVKLNGVLSVSKSVLSGIPQGTVLGPLLFIIYINDLPQVCSNLSRIFYLLMMQKCTDVFQTHLIVKN